MRPSILCFGEVLWDCLPRGLFLGGAPVNVAYHLHNYGLHAIPVTAVGKDFLGDEILRRLKGWGIDARAVARHPSLPTGTVAATLDAAGVPRFSINKGVAWDKIPEPSLPRGVAPTAIVYGTLALRTRANRQTLDALLERFPNALRVADINLRAPFDTASSIAFALRRADLLKLNDGELAQLSGRKKLRPDQLESAARALSKREGIQRLCVTAGPAGAGLLWDDCWCWENAQPVVVRDTIGAGDAFLGAFLATILSTVVQARTQSRAPGSSEVETAARALSRDLARALSRDLARALSRDLARALSRACRQAEYVASQDGPTPEYVKP